MSPISVAVRSKMSATCRREMTKLWPGETGIGVENDERVLARLQRSGRPASRRMGRDQGPMRS